MTEEKRLAGCIDHTNLKAYACDADMKKLCEEAMEYGFAMVAVNSCQTARCRKFLENSDVHVGAAIGFPLGQMTIESKLFEARDAIENGADEIDYVINITELKEKNYDYLEREMREMKDLCHSHGVICKVIFENCYLSEEEIRKMAEIARNIKPDFIKTSTGFGTYGARLEDVRIMKETVGNEVKVKAAGGIRTLEDMMSYIDAGCERIGTSAGVRIMEESRNR